MGKGLEGILTGSKKSWLELGERSDVADEGYEQILGFALGGTKVTK